MFAEHSRTDEGDLFAEAEGYAYHVSLVVGGCALYYLRDRREQGRHKDTKESSGSSTHVFNVFCGSSQTDPCPHDSCDVDIPDGCYPH